MPGVRAVVTLADMITPYGHGVQTAWDGILSGKTVISQLKRFNAGAFVSEYAATIDGLKYHEEESLVMQMFRLIFRRVTTPKDARVTVTNGCSICNCNPYGFRPPFTPTGAGSGDRPKHQALIPQDAKLILATTKGEVDLLEKRILDGRSDTTGCGLNDLLKKVVAVTGVFDSGIIISAACTSSTSAIARAAAMIRSGHTDCVLVVACDAVTEFIYSGFSSLMALDKSPARPFDKHRCGLSIGEAAAYALIMSDVRVEREGREIIGEISGWGLSSDANHMTGPSRDGGGQASAINKALKTAGADAEDIGLIAAHGTGTVYNDAMEMKAFHTVFGDMPRPVYSIKGAIGHTMGAAGLVEMVIALRCLQEGIVPPTVNLADVDNPACGWASSCQKTINNGKMALLTNSGFGGVNAALVLT